ncbi:MAG: hypothetical protein JWQ77_2516 [Jatrophihabitans sp.]|nr:hypothetical protein [Jatrophihabitans sp.]
MPDLEGISPRAAAWLLRVGIPAANDLVKRQGLQVAPDILAALQALAVVADQTLPEMSDRGHAPGNVSPVSRDSWRTTASMAAEVGRSDRHIRRLAASGRVRRLKVGAHWLVDPDSVRSVLGRTA